MAKKAAAKKTKKVPVYQYKKIGTVSVDVGTILIADPCRVNSIAATQTLDAGGHPDMVDSSLMPRGTCFNTRTGEGTVEELAREIVDPATPNRVPNPTRLEDYGTFEGTFVTLKTGFGDGYYDVYAETVNFGDGPLGGERIAAIHMQFVADEDLVPYPLVTTPHNWASLLLRYSCTNACGLKRRACGRLSRSARKPSIWTGGESSLAPARCGIG